MALPVLQFPALTPQQANPVGAGIGQANTLYQQGISNEYMKPLLEQQLIAKALANKIFQAQANVAPQTSAAQLAYQQAKTPNLNAATQYILGGQLPASRAQAGYVGTMAAKNQFQLQHPETMLPGMAGQIGAINTLKSLLARNAIQRTHSSQQTQPQNGPQNTGETIPGMPSAGQMPQNSDLNGAPLLPPNPYGPSSSQGVRIDPQTGIPNTSDLTNLMVQGMTAPIQEKISQANYYQQRGQGYNFSLLPPPEKSFMIAQAAGMGYEPLQAANLLNNGQTISSLAQNKGLDPNNLPSPLYAASQQTVNLIQRRNQALNEINSIQPQITQAMAPYARQFYGYSPSQIAKAIQNDNPDQQARFLAAKALFPEMASLRLKAMGGQVGIEAIREVNNASMGNIKSFQGLVSPKVYAAAQNYVDQWINQGATAANKVGLSGTVGDLNNGGRPVQSSTMLGRATPSNSQPQSQMVRVMAPDGRTGSIPSSNLGTALMLGYRRIK